MSTRRWRRRLLGAVLLVAVGVVAAAVIWVGSGTADGGAPAPSAGSGLPPATATVSRTTLVETDDADGTLGYGETTTVTNRLAGTITSIAGPGTIVSPGRALYAVDTAPVVLMTGELPAYRDIGAGDRGADVRQLEKNLAALGYSGFTVDNQYTDVTAAAVSRWQRDLGLDRTGRVELGRVVFAPGAVRVAQVEAHGGDAVNPGSPVLSYTGTGRVVTVDLPVNQRRLVNQGAEVQVTLPGGATVPGTITAIGAAAQAPENNGGGSEPTVTVTMTVTDPAAADTFDQAPVTVTLVASRREGVLAAPVAALLALPEGGYGVQVVDGAASRIVAVQTGTFAAGLVEISGQGIAEGTAVGVPAT